MTAEDLQKFNLISTFGPIGGEIYDFNLATAGADALDRLRDAVNLRGVLVVRGQQISPARQVEIARHFGAPEIHVLEQYRLAGQPEVLVISNIIENGRPIGHPNAAYNWHSDGSYLAQPTRYAVLTAVELPPAGGDTVFASLAAAWRALPAATKEKIAGKYARHQFAKRDRLVEKRGGAGEKLTDSQKAALADVRHPLVFQHPELGEPCLYVNESTAFAIEGIPQEEAEALLAELSAFSVREEFQYRHQWRPGDVLFWDNWATVHIVERTWGDARRRLHRVTVAGTELTAA